VINIAMKLSTWMHAMQSVYRPTNVFPVEWATVHAGWRLIRKKKKWKQVLPYTNTR